MRFKLPDKKPIETKEAFKEFSEKFQKENKMPFAYAIGVCYKDSNGNTISNKWHTMNIQENMGTVAAILHHFELDMEKTPLCYLEIENPESDIPTIVNGYMSPFSSEPAIKHPNLTALKYHGRICFIAYADESILKEQEIQSIPDAHFRLVAISRLKYKPNTLCLDKLFSILPTLVYLDNDQHVDSFTLGSASQTKSVMTVEEWNQSWPYLHKLSGTVVIDKIPLLSWGAPIPEGVRIPNQHSARLGAYLSPGTTIMHYGYVNHNAGTLGAAMIEGRVSAGTVIGENTDMGACAGFLGTLSGGNTVRVYAGKNCLIGALAECGIPLGDNCVIAAGVVFTANTPFHEVDKNGHREAIPKKASEFSNQPNLTFRRNSSDGCLEVIHKGNKAELNKDLHEVSPKGS